MPVCWWIPGSGPIPFIWRCSARKGGVRTSPLPADVLSVRSENQTRAVFDFRCGMSCGARQLAQERNRWAHVKENTKSEQYRSCNNQRASNRIHYKLVRKMRRQIHSTTPNVWALSCRPAGGVVRSTRFNAKYYHGSIGRRCGRPAAAPVRWQHALWSS